MQAAEARAPEPNLGAGFFVRTASEAPMAQKSDSDAMAEKIVRKEKTRRVAGRASQHMPDNEKEPPKRLFRIQMAGCTRLELATSDVTGRRSNQLS